MSWSDATSTRVEIGLAGRRLTVRDDFLHADERAWLGLHFDARYTMQDAPIRQSDRSCQINDPMSGSQFPERHTPQTGNYQQKYGSTDYRPASTSGVLGP